jgi:hypothetical protein
VPLFIDHLPLASWTDHTQTPPVSHWSVALPVLITEPGLPAPPPGLAIQQWCLDTGQAGEAYAWRHHLIVAGLDPDQQRAPGAVSLTSSLRSRALAPIRRADIWLVSNITAGPGFYRMALERGIPFLDVTTRPDPQFNRPLIGMRALRRARLRVELDFAGDTVSVWTPDPAPPSP